MRKALQPKLHEGRFEMRVIRSPDGFFHSSIIDYRQGGFKIIGYQQHKSFSQAVKSITENAQPLGLTKNISVFTPDFSQQCVVWVDTSTFFRGNKHYARTAVVSGTGESYIIKWDSLPSYCYGQEELFGIVAAAHLFPYHTLHIHNDSSGAFANFDKYKSIKTPVTSPKKVALKNLCSPLSSRNIIFHKEVGHGGKDVAFIIADRMSRKSLRYPTVHSGKNKHFCELLNSARRVLGRGVTLSFVNGKDIVDYDSINHIASTV